MEFIAMEPLTSATMLSIKDCGISVLGLGCSGGCKDRSWAMSASVRKSSENLISAHYRTGRPRELSALWKSFGGHYRRFQREIEAGFNRNFRAKPKGICERTFTRRRFFETVRVTPPRFSALCNYKRE